MAVTPARRSSLYDLGMWADRTALHEAASQGRALQLKQLIESEASVNIVTVDNITPLHEACLQAHPHCARLLLEAGAQVDVRNIHGSTPLCNACSSGSLACVKLLLEYGAKVNPSLTALTASPLHEACIQGNAEIVKLMIASGAELEAYDVHFGPPLHIACAKAHVNCVKELLLAGANVNSSKFHETALHHAARLDKPDMIELLVDFGANVHTTDNLGKKPVEYSTPASPPYDCLRFYESCWSERTEVHKAASLGQASQLQHLIHSGASVNIVAVDSITPLHEACLHGHTQCVRLLLDAGAQVDARNVDGSTPLCDACSVGSLDCVRLLLEYGAKVNPALTSRTASPLHEACMGGNSDCVKFLIAMGACLEAYDLYYGTPLHVACTNKHTNCVKELLNAGAKVNAARLHATALHHAAKSMRVEMIEILVEFGANIYARDKHNKKPVDYTTPGSPAAVCLQSYEATPMSLQQLSRLAVRRKLGIRALNVIGQLQIPKLIISYLCYQ
ncbi:ankyrin repeat and SOCS box protein 13-like isoform X1 [Dunckerocampus dactyliophorus]|uniref:ankyrin repeat and SOCS box protein 13-like isoform X1 n=1 Tax=Dunckerocampus dactyliophorus TaxID=161453 RepID=UPI0024050DA9|nr:ankyrin repeat and SOCS box protein 13-like isoform X1 [Dunckerocampus dactyliophorus]